MRRAADPAKEGRGETALESPKNADRGACSEPFPARFLVADTLIFLTLLAAGWRYTDNLQRKLDILLSDEARYLTQGVEFYLNFAPPNAQSGPLYSAWYSLLVPLSRDAESLFFLNYRLVMIIPPALLYVLLRRLKVSIFTASFAALLLLISTSNLSVTPRISHFLLIVLFTFFILASITKDSVKTLLVLGLGFLLAAYARPEMFVAFLICFTAAIATYFFLERTRSNLLLLGSLATLAGAASLASGPVIVGPRSSLAFAQHYSRNWLVWNEGSELDPNRESDQIMNYDFGRATSVFDAATTNPAAFLNHVRTNLANLPASIAETFAINPAIPYALDIPPLVFKSLFAVIAAICMIAGLRTLPRRLSHLRRNDRWLLLWLAITSAVMVLVCLVIYPREHYVFVLGALLLGVLAIVLDPFRERRPTPWRTEAAVALCAAVAILVVTPSIGNYGPAGNRPRSHLVGLINSLGINSEVRLFNFEGGLATYVARDWGRPSCKISRCGTWTWFREKGAVPFDRFRTTNDINMVLVTPQLLRFSTMRVDPEWKTFLDRPELAGFEKFVLPGAKQHNATEQLKTPLALYVAKAILGTAG